MTHEIAPIQQTLEIPLPVEEAFVRFVQRFNDWWPQEYTWSQDALISIGLEATEGGRCTEVGPHGFQVDWGRVLTWNPPVQVVFTWQISPTRVPQPDPEQASVVDVRFRALAPGTTEVLFEHRALHRHGDGAAGYADALRSEYGWPFILAHFRAFAASAQ